MNSEVLKTDRVALFEAAVARAAELLRGGRLVALPTETVYGLAANALDAQAVASIYEVKGRPQHNPIIVHVASLDMARQCVASWPDIAGQLAAAFWPGPLTLVLPKASRIPDIVTAGGATVGVRWPSHPFIQAVIQACGFPLAAPSANRSNEISPTTARHVQRSLGGRIPLIIDGGPAHVGIESTVLDLTNTPARVLRPGMIHTESLAAAAPGGAFSAHHVEAGILRSPGMLKKHYSPKAKLVVFQWVDDGDLGSQVSRFDFPAGKVQILTYSHAPAPEKWGRVSVMPHNPAAYARAFYAELHRCDETGAELIVVEAPPRDDHWRGVADRLARAAA